MEMNIYLDVFFLLNFIVNFCLLHSCGMILRCNRTIGYTVLAAFFGSLASCAFLFIPMKSEIWPMFPVCVRFFTAMGMTYLSYGKDHWKSFLREVLCLYFSSFALEGVLRFTHSIGGLILLLAVSYGIGKEKRKRQNRMLVTLTFKEKSVVLHGFYDTGNRLTEQITGRMAHIVSYDSIKKILPESYRMVAEHYFETGLLESTKVTELQMYEFTFLSYHSIGKETGELLGIRMDAAVFETDTGKKTEEKAVIALTNQKKLMENHCQIIINGRLEI